MRLVDTHSHLNDDQLVGDIDGVIARAKEHGVEAFLNVGTTRQSSVEVLQTASRYPCIRAAVGIHPNYVHLAEENDWSAIETLSDNPLVAAIGETGLDRYWKDAPWDLQLESFERHFQLAAKRRLPLVIHMRECEAEMVEFLRSMHAKYEARGVMHSFNATWDICKACLDLGMFISFAGQLTYKKSSDLREVASRVPRDRLLVETDAPYLSPEPMRSQRPNEPARVAFTLKCLAETCGLAVEAMGERTTENAYTLFPRLAVGKLS